MHFERCTPCGSSASPSPPPPPWRSPTRAPTTTTTRSPWLNQPGSRWLRRTSLSLRTSSCTNQLTRTSVWLGQAPMGLSTLSGQSRYKDERTSKQNRQILDIFRKIANQEEVIKKVKYCPFSKSDNLMKSEYVSLQRKPSLCQNIYLWHPFNITPTTGSIYI